MQRILTAALVAVLLLAAGCDRAPPEPLRIGAHVWVGYEPLYLARELGHFDDAEIQLVEYASGTQSLRAFRNGVIDAAALTLDETILLSQHGHDPAVVLVMDISHGADALVARPEIATLAELRGRRIGAEKTALGAYVLARILEHAGLTEADIIPVSLELSEHLNAYRDGEIDAVVTADPWRTQILADGGRQLFDSSAIPGEIVDVLVIRRALLEQRPAQVAALLRGWFAALGYIEQQPTDAAARMGARIGLSGEQFLEALTGIWLPDLDDNLHLLNGGGVVIQTAANLQQVMLQQRLLQAPVDVTRLPDVRALHAVSEDI